MGPVTVFAELHKGIPGDPGCLDAGKKDAKDEQGDPGGVVVSAEGLELLFELLNDQVADAGEKEDGADPGEGAVAGA